MTNQAAKEAGRKCHYVKETTTTTKAAATSQRARNQIYVSLRGRVYCYIKRAPPLTIAKQVFALIMATCRANRKRVLSINRGE